MYVMIYNNLSNYLLQQIVEAQTAKTPQPFWGILGGFFGFCKVDVEDDAITKLLAEQEVEAEKNIEKRIADLEKSREAAYIEKLKTQFANKEKQADLLNQQRIRKFKAAQERLKNEQKLIKQSKTLKTASQMDAYNEMLENEIKEAEGSFPDDAKRMQDIMRIMTYKEDGSARTSDEIKEFAESEGGKKYFDEYKKLAGTHSADIETAIKDPKFSKLIETANGLTEKRTQAKDELKQAEANLKDFQEKDAAVRTYKSYKEKYNNAQEEYKKTNDAFNALSEKLGGDNPAFKIKDGNEYELEPTSGFDAATFVGNKYIELINSGEYKNADGDTKTSLERNFYEKIGLNPDSIEDTNMFKPDSEGAEITAAAITEKLNAKYSTDEDAKERFETRVIENESNAYKKAKQDKEAKKQVLDSVPNPDDPASLEGNSAISQEDMDKLNAYKGMEENDKTLLSDPNSDAYKEFKTNVEKRKTDAEKQYKTIESLQEARKERVKEAISSESRNTEFKELEHDVSVLTQGANDGEIIKNKEDSDGNVTQVQGFYKDGEFIERPDDSADDEKKKQYEKDLKTHLLTGDQSLVDTAGKKLEKDADGKYYVTDSAGERKEVQKNEAAAILAAKELETSNKKLQQQAKSEAIKKTTGIFTDGKFDKTKYDALSDEDKETIKTVLKDPKGVCKGVDLTGSDSLKNLTNIINTGSDSLPDDLKSLIPQDITTGGDDQTNNTGGDDQTNNTGGDGDDEESDEYEEGDEFEDIENEGDDAEEGDDEDVDDTDDEAEFDELEIENGKGKLKNPSKIWKRRKNKRTHKPTKSYYNGKKDEDGNWISISKEEYKEKLRRYRARKQKNAQRHDESSIQYNDLKNYLVEVFGI